VIVAATNEPTKAEMTKSTIVDAAMSLFAERGYEQTTMRAVAESAGVSVGNAYYYFPSKEALMQGYYANLLTGFAARSRPVLETEERFGKRLSGVLHAWVENARPYHGFAGGFFKFAANPDSPLSPFSPESAPTRDASIELMTEVIEGSKRLRISDDLRPELPRLLWLFEMGVVLHWVHDKSVDQAKTLTLIDRTVPLIERLVALSKLPVLKSATNEIVKLVNDLAGPAHNSRTD